MTGPYQIDPDRMCFAAMWAIRLCCLRYNQQLARIWIPWFLANLSKGN
jgi:hypothetical protein